MTATVPVQPDARAQASALNATTDSLWTAVAQLVRLAAWARAAQSAHGVTCACRTCDTAASVTVHARKIARDAATLLERIAEGKE
jgi:hypothetical protein